ncbi:MAG: aminotransferase class III-fold pyridoxal phosphate-dependent enzyme [Pirellulaceae bacterium]
MTKPSVSQSSPVPRHSSADASASTAQEGAESADQSRRSGWAVEHLRAVDRRHLWHAFTPMRTYVPFIIERAEGFELIDVDGRRYLDAESSLWCSVHGHGEPHIDAAIRAQLDRVAHVTLLGMTSDTTVRLTEQLLQRAPGFERVFYSSDGAVHG